MKVACRGGLSTAILDDEDVAVTAELERRQRSRNENTLTTKVMDQHRVAWGKLGLAFITGRGNVLSGDRSSPWWGTLCTRKQACLEFFQHTRKQKRDAPGIQPQEYLQRIANFAVVDLSPGIGSLTMGWLDNKSELCTMTVLPGSDLWVSMGQFNALNNSGRAIHRSVIGEESLMLIGWPTRDPRFRALVASRSNSFLQDIAGNAFAGSCLIAVLCSFFLAAERNDASDAAEVLNSDVGEALRLLKRARHT
jgi:hypothetical protein